MITRVAPPLFLRGMLPLALWLLGVNPAFSQGFAPEARAAFERGRILVQQQQWTQADEQFQEALKLAPDVPEILLNLARVNDRRGGRELVATAWYRAYLAAMPETVERDSIKSRINALLQTVTTRAADLIDKAATASGNLSPKDRVGSLRDIAAARAKAGDIAGAWDAAAIAASLGSDKYDLSRLFAGIVSACAARSEMSCVDSAIDRSNEPYVRDAALRDAVTTLARVRNFSSASSYATRASNGARISAYLTIAEEQHKAGDNATARQSLQSATNALITIPANDTGDYTSEIERLTRLAASLGELDRTSGAFDRLRMSELRIDALRTLSIAFASVGDRSNARQTFHKATATHYDMIGDQNYKFTAIYSVRSLLLTASVLDDAESINRLLAGQGSLLAKYYQKDDYAKSRRGEALAAAGRYSEAEAFVSQMRDSNQRKSLTESIDRMRRTYVEALVKAGRFEDAVAALPAIRESTDRGYARNSIDWELQRRVDDLINAGEYDRADILVPKIQDNYYRTSFTDKITKANRDKVAALIKAGNLTAAEVALSQEPRVGAYAGARLDLAKTYYELGDLPAMRRMLETVASSLSRASNITIDPKQYAEICASLAENYIKAGDKVAARRIVEVSGKTVLGMAEQDSKKTALQTLAIAHARIAKAERETNGASAAKTLIRQAISLADRINGGSERARALYDIVELFPQAGFPNELVAAAEGLPSDFYKDKVLNDAVADFVVAGEAAKVLPTAAKISDAYYYQSAISKAIAAHVEKSDWAGALTLAHEPRAAVKAASEIVRLMLGAGLFDEAASLEAQFTGTPDEAANYYRALASLRARNGQFDAAISAALRIPTTVMRVQYLYSLAETVRNLAGAGAAKLFTDAAAQIPLPAFGSDQWSICSTLRSYRAYGTDNETRPAGSALSVACLPEALAIGTQKDRVNALQSVFASPTLTSQPQPGSTLAPVQPALSRWIMEGADSSELSTREYQAAYAATALAREGAIEKAMRIIGPANEYAKSVYVEAARWLVDSGARPIAQEMARQLTNYVEARNDESAKERGFADLVSLLVALGDFERAEQFTLRMKSPSSQASNLAQIAQATATVGQSTFALRVLEKAKHAAHKSGDNSRLRFLNLSAQAGDKNIEALVQELQTRKDEYPKQSIYSARDTVMRSLLRWKQRERARALIPAQEKALTELDPSSRWASANNFVQLLAWAGDIGRMVKLVNEAPIPAFKAALLIASAEGFAKAGKADEARTALSRALDVLQINRPDFDAWADSQIALAQEETDPEQTNKRAAAIVDPGMRAWTIAALAKSRYAKGRLAAAAVILQAAPPSSLIDMQLPRAVRYLTGKNDVDGAHALIAKAAHPVIRDKLRSYAALALARLGNAQAALAEANSVADVPNRAYALIDVGEALIARDNKDRPDISYFAQLGFFSAGQLADTMPNDALKADVLAGVAQGQEKLDPGVAAVTRARAEAVAGTITDPQARQAAQRWAMFLQAPRRPDALAVSERNDWIGHTRYSLNDQIFTNFDGFMETIASKPAAQMVSLYLGASGKLSDTLTAMNKQAADWTQKRKQTSN